MKRKSEIKLTEYQYYQYITSTISRVAAQLVEYQYY